MRVLLLASLFLICNFLSVLGGAIFAQQDDLVALYEQAKSAESSGDYKTAVADYEKIIQLRPDMAEAYANAGNLYYLQGDAHHAELYFKKAIRLKPGLSGPYFFLGVLAFKGRAYPSALKYLKQAETLDAKNPLIQSYLGYTQFALHNYADAVGYLEKAAAAAPEDIDVFYHLSKVYANVAKTYFERLQADYAGSFYTALARAHLYESQENWDLALQQYDAALKERPADNRLQQKRQEMVSRKGGNAASTENTAKSDSDIDGSLVFFYNPPSGSAIHDNLTDYQQRVKAIGHNLPLTPEQLYRTAEDYQVLSYLANQWVFEIDPESYRAHQIKAQYYEELNKDDKAIAEYRRAVELNPALPNIHFLIGNLYWRREKPEEALPELQKELQSDPDHPEALYEIGDIFLLNGRVDEAERHFLKSLKLDPSMEEAHLALERIYTEKREYEKALMHLQKAIAINPKDPTPHYKLSMLYKKLGRLTESQNELKTFAKLKSTQPSAARQ